MEHATAVTMGNRRAAWLAALAIGLPASVVSARSTPGAAAGELRSEIFRTGPAPLVEVDNLYGAVEVMAGPDDTVSIEARISGAREGAAGSFRVALESTPTGVRARSTCAGAGSRFAWCGRQRVDFVLHVPALASLDLRGVGTDLRVVGVRGEVDVSTVSGSIDVREAGVVRAESLSGCVRIEHAAAAEVSAGDGNVELLSMRKGTVIYHSQELGGAVSRGEEPGRRSHRSTSARSSESAGVLSADADDDSEPLAKIESRSLVIRGTEALVRALLFAFHHGESRSCSDDGDC